MENQSPVMPSETKSPQPAPIGNMPQGRMNFFIPILLTGCVSAIVFGLSGYYLGKQSPTVTPGIKQPTISVTSQPTPTQQVITLTPTVIPSASPSATVKPVKKLTYSLPSNWKTLSDTGERLNVGYDSTKYDATAKADQVNLSGKWTGTGTNMRRLGGNKNIYLMAYGGGSRHDELYKILGVSAGTSDWKSPKYYSEKEYSYNGWKCLVINGVDISQYPVAWGYCPISSKEALVLALDNYDWTEIEQQISAVRLSR